MTFGPRWATAALSITTINHRSSAFSSLSLPARAPHSPSSVSVRTQTQAKDFLRFAMSSSSSVSAVSEDKVNVPFNIASVRQRIQDAMISNNRPDGSVRLVAVSKTKPLELLVTAYEAGQRFFGENYAQELMTKSTEMPDDVSWHFIGPLQSNKAAPLVKTVGLKKLACVETVSTLKLATKLNRAAEAWNDEEGLQEKKKLGVYIQVNTSGEDSKSGVTPGVEVIELIKLILDECPLLSINGLMTIGSPGDYSCFDTLVKCRDEVAAALDKDPNELELSMGMSGDFEIAIARGATNVRVGSTIFGDRDYST